MKTKPPSWKTVVEQRRREHFVGREEQLRVFKDNFAGDIPNFMVFAITGEGGVGKSTLLQQYANLAAAPDINALVITCDDRHISPAQAMGHIAAELAKLEITHKEFDERYKKYRELREEIESDPKAPRGAVDLLARGVTDFAIKSGRQLPGVGVLFEDADEKAAGDTLSQLINYGINRWGNKDELLLLSETDRVLTPLFLKLLAKASEKRRVLLMFDVFERTATTLSPWLLALCNFEYGEFDTNLTFVIAGRDSLEQHWTEMAGALCQLSLEPFSSDETRRYLGLREITDDHLVTQIHEDTGGLPVLVELLAATRPQPGAPLRDVSQDAVKRFLQWIPQEERRRTVLLAAVPRRFDRDTLTAALGADATEAFVWLSAQSFVRRSTDRGSGYHEKVRELILRHLRNTTPKELEETHARLAKFFAAEQAVLGLEGRAAYDSETWRDRECERVYHLVGAQSDRNRSDAVNAFLHAFRWRWGFANRIAQACRQIGLEKGIQSVRELASVLSEFHEAYDQENWRVGIERLGSLERQEGLTVTAQCEIHALYGVLYLRDGKYDQALSRLTRAANLDEKYDWAFALRGETYRLMERYEEALADLIRAVELNGKSSWAFALRGNTYRLLGRYEEALADLTYAIELNGKHAWAFALRGSTHRLLEYYEEALADLARAIELNGKHIWAFAERGVTYRLLEKYEDALADLTRVIELNGKSAWAFALRGNTHRLLEKYEEALADFSRAIELNEKYVWAFAERSDTYLLMDDYEAALADRSRAIALDEKYAWEFTNRGEAYDSMEIYEDALADLSRAIELNEKPDRAFAHRGEVNRLLGRYSEALTDLNRAIEMDEKSAWAFANRGEVNRLLGKYNEALADLNRAIELNDKDDRALSHRGKTYRLMGKYEEAIEDLTAVVKSGTANADDFCQRAAAYHSLGDAESARTDLAKVLELPLEGAWTYYGRGLALALTGKTSEALEMLREAFRQDLATKVYAETDDLLDPLRSLPEFQKLLADCMSS